MKKSIGIITVHGMGKTKSPIKFPKDHYATQLHRKLRKKLRNDEFQSIAWGFSYYQDVLQENQERLFAKIAMKTAWLDLREFLMFGFSDAATLEANKWGVSSPYYQAQLRLLQTFREVYAELEEGAPLFIIAQSLGGQVMSNYLWDAGKTTPPSNTTQPIFSVWSAPQNFSSHAEREFCRGFRVRRFYTTGCNIPIFVAGLDREMIKPITPRHPEFEWRNYYDSADVLGYPLRDLSDGYDELVDDYRVRAGATGGFSPFSHVRYWTDDEILNPLVRDIRDVLP